MNVKTFLAPSTLERTFSTWRTGSELVLVSFLILFLELACIRWFPAHVVYLTFFTNTVLLACFLGMSVGCLAAGRTCNLLAWTPILLGLALAAGHGVEYLHSHDLPDWSRHLLARITGGQPTPSRLKVDVGNQAAPELVFFGTDYKTRDLADFFLPIEVLGGFFFLVIALAFMGPGQELGRAFKRLPNRVLAYTFNILGSVAGILLFAACAYWEVRPFWWFLLVAVGLGYFLVFRLAVYWLQDRWAMLANLLGVLAGGLWLVSWTSGPLHPKVDPLEGRFWSPYYRIDYDRTGRFIGVNLIGHQKMLSRDNNQEPTFAYSLPHLLNRDAGGKVFRNVLIIGAGSGNDVSRALQWGAEHIDAVEIDPVILRLGRRDHPDQPYQDPRVSVHLDDGRNFLRSCERKYDLILYALVDSLVLHSSFSNIRLESYLFTRQAFADARRCLDPDGLFVLCNYFRQGWIVNRLEKGLEEVFADRPLILTLPYQAAVEPGVLDGFTMFFAGNTTRLREAFQRRSEYWLPHGQSPSPDSPNGFAPQPTPEERDRWERFGLATVEPLPTLETASDDWPFLYLRERMIPSLTLRGMAIQGGLSLVLILLFLPGGRGFSFSGRMFFLGAGFMLIETRAVVHLALLFGSTWMVNSVVFLAVLGMVLAANLFVLTVRPVRLWTSYAGLLIALTVNSMVPLDSFLGLGWTVRVIGSCLLVFAPILFAGVIFAVSFAQSAEPDRAFGANIAGAILGGLAENASLLLGFQSLLLAAIVCYALSALSRHRMVASGRM